MLQRNIADAQFIPVMVSMPSTIVSHPIVNWPNRGRA
jgi:hypothetical protein